MTTEQRVRAIVAKHLNVHGDQILPNSRLEDLGADSLDATEICMELEDQFCITLPDAAHASRSVQELVAYTVAAV